MIIMEEGSKGKGRKQSASTSDSISTSSSSTFFERDFLSLLSDAGIYSYAALISLELHELFDNHWDRKFCVQYISVLLNHLSLPEQVQSTMISLLEGAGSQNINPYRELILLEMGFPGRAALIIEDLLYLAVRGGKYDSRTRVLIQHLSKDLNVPSEIFELYEVSVVHFLTQQNQQFNKKEQDELSKKRRNRKIKRYALIGLATLGGGAVLGLTGGLAAPLIGAGVGTLLGASSAAVLGSTAGAAIIGSLFGAAGAGLTGYKMKKRIGAIEEFEFGVLTGSPCKTTELHITIAVSGWINDKSPDNFIRPWKSLLNSHEQYFLRYESKYLLDWGRAMEYILGFAISMASQVALKYTALNGILNAIAWPASLVTLADLIDNPWSVCCGRSAEVGKQLAEVLLNRKHGQRPVTLIGYSWGARVIYYCLSEMVEHEDCEGIIQDAILLGTPVSDLKGWNKLTRVVAGRIINGYSKSDWLLKFMFRTLSMTSKVAGLEPIEINDRRFVNVDLTDIVSGHNDYSTKMEKILKLINIRTVHEVPGGISLMRKSLSDNLHPRRATLEPFFPLRPSKSDESIAQSK